LPYPEKPSELLHVLSNELSNRLEKASTQGGPTLASQLIIHATNKFSVAEFLSFLKAFN
jgi:hypothetical protein